MTENRHNRKFSLTWVVIAILSAATLWIVISNLGSNNTGMNTAIMPDTSYKRNQMSLDSAMNRKIVDFITFVQDSSKSQTIEKGFIENGMQKLSAAINSIINRNDTLKVNLQPGQDTLKQIIENISNNTDITQNTILIKNAMLTTADLIKSINKNHLELKKQISKIQNNAEAINPNQPILNQENNLKSFFYLSAKVLQQMIITKKPYQG
jgi:hypothetical protein